MADDLQRYRGIGISLVTRIGLRYTGVLEDIKQIEGAIALSDVRCSGSEDRIPDPSKYVPPSETVYSAICFAASDIIDLNVLPQDGNLGPPVMQNVARLQDPAILTIGVPKPAAKASSALFSPQFGMRQTQHLSNLVMSLSSSGMERGRGPSFSSSIKPQQNQQQQKQNPFGFPGQLNGDARGPITGTLGGRTGSPNSTGIVSNSGPKTTGPSSYGGTSSNYNHHQAPSNNTTKNNNNNNGGNARSGVTSAGRFLGGGGGNSGNSNNVNSSATQRRGIFVPDEEFDFDHANAKLCKQDLIAEFQKMGVPAKATREDNINNTLENTNNNNNDNNNNTQTRVKTNQDGDYIRSPGETQKKEYYDPDTSFFDKISRDTHERTENNQGGRLHMGFAEERKLNMNTFGAPSSGSQFTGYRRYPASNDHGFSNNKNSNSNDNFGNRGGFGGNGGGGFQRGGGGFGGNGGGGFQRGGFGEGRGGGGSGFQLGGNGGGGGGFQRDGGASRGGGFQNNRFGGNNNGDDRRGFNRGHQHQQQDSFGGNNNRGGGFNGNNFRHGGAGGGGGGGFVGPNH